MGITTHLYGLETASISNLDPSKRTKSLRPHMSISSRDPTAVPSSPSNASSLDLGDLEMVKVPVDGQDGLREALAVLRGLSVLTELELDVVLLRDQETGNILENASFPEHQTARLVEGKRVDWVQ
ncbi:uncharacterized protein PG986_006542 [Apiospora aurea]|uniref:Uncharacterized protein n=1 Tax=Apiospora aurea TaxID=335848 RepID=A0ABR1QKQ9_9PEZI